MQCYWNYCTFLNIFVYCLFLYSDTQRYVTALASDTAEKGSEDPLSIPLISNKGAPLVAMLDTHSINRNIKSYIKALMESMIKQTLEGYEQEFVQTSLEENSTINLIRNNTLQELNGNLNVQVQHVQGTPKDCTELRAYDTVTGEVKKSLCANFHELVNTGSILYHMPLKTIRATTGVYTIFPDKTEGVKAYCDMDTDSGGELLSRKYDNSVNFQRSWTDCENGFGNVNWEYWLGNKYVHRLTSSGTYELRIGLTDKKNKKKYAKYKKLIVGDAASQYKLTIGGYSGDAGDSLNYSNGLIFSTVDMNYDLSKSKCAEDRGPWWFNNCAHSSLNNPYIGRWYWYHKNGHL